MSSRRSWNSEADASKPTKKVFKLCMSIIKLINVV